jgi:hypothetical protein
VGLKREILVWVIMHGSPAGRMPGIPGTNRYVRGASSPCCLEDRPADKIMIGALATS